MQIVMDLERAKAVFQALSTNKDLTVTGTVSAGDIHSHDVDLEYIYNGVDTMLVNVVQKNSFLARHASDMTIEAHIHDLLNKV